MKGQESKMKLSVKIKYWLLVGFNKTIGFLPTWFLYYPMVDIIYFLIYRVARYRIKVVRWNLETSFPEKSKKELRSIERGFYKHLAEIMIDSIDMAGVSEKEMRKRVVVENVEEHEKRMEGKNWIAAIAHYGSWEYFSAYQLYTKSQVVGLYKPLHDKAFDEYYRYCRSRMGLEPVSMKVILRYILEHNKPGKRNISLGFIADQSTKPNEHTQWYDFLNHKTMFYSGIERIALKFNFPVYYLDTRKVGRRRYRAHFELLYDGTEKVREGEITQRYISKLEQVIREEPRYWMWSHRRWKFGYPDCPGSRSGDFDVRKMFAEENNSAGK